MQKEFTLQIPESVICGAGCIDRLPEMIREAGKTNIAVFADIGALKSGSIDKVLEELKKEFKVTLVDDVPPEPEDRQVRAIFDEVKSCGAELIVAIGGGSVMDTTKMIAVMMTNPDYYDDLTDKSKIVNKGAPLYVAPTSAGTGSEATPNSIVLIPEQKLKVGVVHPYFLPAKVLLDPMLTKSLPQSVTAATGLDAFCHCIETYISRKTNPFARLFGLKGIELITANLRKAYADGTDMEAREAMLLAAFYGGVAITASSTVAVHALSYPLGGTYRIAHGVSNAILLPYVMQFNMDAIPDCVTPIAEAMGIKTEGLSVEEQGQKVVDEIFALCRDVKIPDSLKPYGVKEEDLESLTVAASEVHRLLDQNPKDMSLDDIRSIYKQLL